MNSCLYECAVFHRRLHPKQHEFLYRVFFFLLDFDELEELGKKIPLLGIHRRGIFSFHARDHLGKQSSEPLRPRLEAWLAEQGVDRPAKILFLTNLRIFGYVFNPIAIYFCFDSGGRPLAAVAQVGNTFGEQKLFLVPATGTEPDWAVRVQKNFYVSPFSSLDLSFDFRFFQPGETLRVLIDDYAGTEKVLISTLTGKRRALTTSRLLWFLCKYPLLTLRIIFLIHWQAFRLWWKKVPHHNKEDKPEEQTGILNPQGSLTDSEKK